MDKARELYDNWDASVLKFDPKVPPGLRRKQSLDLPGSTMLTCGEE